jgi:hypothetical protein
VIFGYSDNVAVQRQVETTIQAVQFFDSERGIKSGAGDDQVHTEYIPKVTSGNGILGRCDF